MTTVVALLCTPAAAHAIPSGDAIGLLNAQRAASGIPGDLTEDPSLTRGCDNHNYYMTQNGFGHGEEPGRPGYTAEGADIGRAEVLSAGEGWSTTENPWTDAPIHEYLMFRPARTTAGYAYSHGFACMRLGGERPAATSAEFYSYPGNGLTGVPVSEPAAESPYTPQELVGIPDGEITGSSILLFSRGFGQDLHAESASLVGPRGPEEILMVEEGTRREGVGNGSLFAGGGVMIPRRALAPYGSYRGEVVWRNRAGAQATQAFTFETDGLPNEVQVNYEQDDETGAMNLLVQSEAANRRLAVFGPGTTQEPALDGEGRTRVFLEPGAYSACGSSGGRDVGYRAATTCVEFTVRGVSHLVLRKAKKGARQITLEAFPGAVLGRSARVVVTHSGRRCSGKGAKRRCSWKTVHRKKTKLALAAAQTIKVPARRSGDDLSVEVSLAAFTLDGVEWEAADVSRDYR